MKLVIAAADLILCLLIQEIRESTALQLTEALHVFLRRSRSAIAIIRLHQKSLIPHPHHYQHCRAVLGRLCECLGDDVLDIIPQGRIYGGYTGKYRKTCVVSVSRLNFEFGRNHTVGAIPPPSTRYPKSI